MSVKVSIIVPVYNSAKTLRRCADSILNQDFTESSNWVIGEYDSYKSEIADGNYIFTTKKHINN